MNELRVGASYPEFVGRPDGCHATVGASGIVFMVLIDSPTRDERAAARKTAQIRFVPHGSVGVFVVKLGDQPWFDAPYAPGILPERPPLEPIGDGRGLALTVVIADTRTGKLVELRVIGLGTEFSQAFANWYLAAHQLTVPEYHAAVDAALTQSSSRLASLARPELRYSAGR